MYILNRTFIILCVLNARRSILSERHLSDGTIYFASTCILFKTAEGIYVFLISLTLSVKQINDLDSAGTVSSVRYLKREKIRLLYC